MQVGKFGNSFYKKKFWKNKRVLITGHTGFKGVWLSLMLAHIGVKKIYGISLRQNSNSFFNRSKFNKIIKTFHCDINDYKKLRLIICKIKPDFTFNFAAQSIVSEGYKYPLKTYKTNILGSINVLYAVKSISPFSTIIMATTDKVYKIKYKKNYFTEEDKLGGYDPYSASKASLEILLDRYVQLERKKLRLGIATCRTGNVIGGGDFSKDRIIPDIFRSLKNKKKLKIRFRDAVRPWQHVFEPLNQYISLAEKIYNNKKKSGSYNFGPQKKDQVSVGNMINTIKKRFSILKIHYVKNKMKETKYLMLNTNKIYKTLNIKNNLSLSKSLELTFDWYEQYLKKRDIFKFSKKQIQDYFNFF
jgi:CDP-glucose 4,6-dehydratase